MLFKPAQLGLARLDPAELAADRKACKKIGPCGVGKKALYLNSFYIDRRYYLPYTSITRVFKRVAMSAGGFTGKGMFASMAYLVVEYDGGKQKQCNFKDERDVDALLELLAKQQPQIRLQLSMVLQAVVSQQLVPGVDGQPVPVFEIMFTNMAIRNMIRESKSHQIDSVIASGGAQGMRTMDMALVELVQQRKITVDTALTYCVSYETVSRRLHI